MERSAVRGDVPQITNSQADVGIYVDLAMCIEPRDLCKTFRAPILGSDDDSAVIVLTS